MKSKTKALVTGAMISAIYVLLSLLSGMFTINGIQLRLSEALTILPVFTPAAVPGLFVGCFVTNLFSGNIIDIVFGSLATFLGAAGTRAFRKKKIMPFLSPVISNTLIIPFVIKYAYGLGQSFLITAATVLVSEAISVFIFGGILKKYANGFFER